MFVSWLTTWRGPSCQCHLYTAGLQENASIDSTASVKQESRQNMDLDGVWHVCGVRKCLHTEVLMVLITLITNFCMHCFDFQQLKWLCCTNTQTLCLFQFSHPISIVGTSVCVDSTVKSQQTPLQSVCFQGIEEIVNYLQQQAACAAIDDFTNHSTYQLIHSPGGLWIYSVSINWWEVFALKAEKLVTQYVTFSHAWKLDWYYIEFCWNVKIAFFYCLWNGNSW